MSITRQRVLSDRSILGLVLALGACIERHEWTPEGEVEGTFEGLSNDCRCVGHAPKFSLSCAGSQIEIDGVEQRFVFDIDFLATVANTRANNLSVWGYIADMRGYVGAEGAWFGGELIPDPRSGHMEQYRALGFDALFAPEQAYRRENENTGIERGPLRATDVRVWCEDRP